MPFGDALNASDAVSTALEDRLEPAVHAVNAHEGSPPTLEYCLNRTAGNALTGSEGLVTYPGHALKAAGNALEAAEDARKAAGDAQLESLRVTLSCSDSQGFADAALTDLKPHFVLPQSLSHLAPELTESQWTGCLALQGDEHDHLHGEHDHPNDNLDQFLLVNLSCVQHQGASDFCLSALSGQHQT